MKRRRGAFGYVVSTGTPSHPSFAIRWREGKTHRKQSGFSTRGAADEALARVRVGLSDGTLVEKRRAGVKLDTVAREWLRLHSEPNLRSHADNRERYDRHIAPELAEVSLAALTATRVLELRAHLQGKRSLVKRRGASGKARMVPGAKLAGATVNRVLALLRSILRYAVTSGRIAAAPTDRIGRGRYLVAVPKTKLAPPLASPADVGRLLAELRAIGEETNRPGLRGLFATLVYTGVRRGEACGARWTDLDLERRVFTVRRSYTGVTKSGRDRTVPLPTPLVAILRAHRLACPYKGPLAFPNDAGAMFSPNAKLEAVLRSALSRASLPRLRVHQLRHQFACDFVRAGGDIFVLQRILGHSSPVITADTYAHLAPGHLSAEADRVSYPEPEIELGKVLKLKGDE